GLLMARSKAEAALRNRVLPRLEQLRRDAQGALWLRSVSDSWMAGLPDMEMVYRGRSIHIEFKAVDGSLTKGQRVVLPELARAGASVYIVRAALDAPGPFAAKLQRVSGVSRPGQVLATTSVPLLLAEDFLSDSFAHFIREIHAH